jgi:hypothetical protein
MSCPKTALVIGMHKQIPQEIHRLRKFRSRVLLDGSERVPTACQDFFQGAEWLILSSLVRLEKTSRGTEVSAEKITEARSYSSQFIVKIK